MKILLTGESGMLGSAIKKHLTNFPEQYQFVETTDLIQFTNQFHFINGFQVKPSEWNITIHDNYKKLMDRVSNDTIIVHTAAYVNTDKCDDEPYQSVKSNILGTQMLIQLAKNRQCQFINFSTTAVFDPETYMQAGGIFTESCFINPKTLYGLTKYNAELAVKQALRYAITLKPVFIYGDAPYDNSSNIRKIIDAMINNTTIPIKPLQITLDGSIKKNYMRVEFFVQMFKKIIDNISYCIGKDFIISRDPSLGKEFNEYLLDIEAIVKTEVSTYINLVPSKDYLQTHLGYSMNFHQRFPDFVFEGNVSNDIEGIKKTYQSILKLHEGINKISE